MSIWVDLLVDWVPENEWLVWGVLCKQMNRYLTKKRNYTKTTRYSIAWENLHMMEMALQNRYHWNEYDYKEAVEYSRIDILELLRRHQKCNYKQIWDIANARGNLKIMKWASRYYDNPKPNLRVPAEHGYVHIIKWLVQRGSQMTPELSKLLVLSNKKEAIEWAASISHINEDLLHQAVLADLDVTVGWFYDHGMVSEKYIWIWEVAAYHGSLKVMKTLKKYLPIPAKVCQQAALCRNAEQSLKCVKWLHQQGCDCTNICSYAAHRGNLKLLKWAYAQGCEINAAVFNAANRMNQIAVIRWLIRVGCPQV